MSFLDPFDDEDETPEPWSMAESVLLGVCLALIAFAAITGGLR